MFNRRNRQPDGNNRRLTVSDWENAPIEEVTGNTHPPAGGTDSSTSGSDGGSGGSGGADEEPPQMDLGSIYSSIEKHRRLSDVDEDQDDTQAEVSTPVSQVSGHIHRKGSTGRSSRKLMPFKAPSKARSSFSEDDLTVAPSSSASHTSYSSSAGTNIWTKLMGGSGTDNGLWDGLNSKKGDIFDETEEFEDEYMDQSCSKNMKRCGLAWWYETKHFMKTVWQHPHIWMLSLFTFGVLCAVGMVAINAEADSYAQKQKGTAEFVVS